MSTDLSIRPMNAHRSRRSFARASIAASLLSEYAGTAPPGAGGAVPVVAAAPRKRVMRLLLPTRHASQASHAASVAFRRFSSSVAALPSRKKS